MNLSKVQALKPNEDISKIVEVLSSIKMVEASNFDIYFFNPVTLRITCVSQGMTDHTGYSKEELLGMHLYELNIEYDKVELLTLLKPLLDRTQKSIRLETKRRYKNGNIVAVTACIQTIVEAGNHRIVVMSHEKVEENGNTQSDDLICGLLSKIESAAAVIDPAMNIKQTNHTFCQIIGKSMVEVLGKNINLLGQGREDSGIDIMTETLASNGRWHGVIWKTKYEGKQIPFWVNCTPYQEPDGQNRGYIVVINEYDDRDASAHLASNKNSLTGLPNRLQFIEYGNHHLKEANAHGEGSAVFYIDINNFKKVNELLGRDGGDHILVSVAERIISSTKLGDIVANVAADEFAIFVTGIDTYEQASMIAMQLIGKFDNPFVYKGQNFRITISMGVALYQNNQHSTKNLIQNAEHAVNSAKCLGCSNFHVYKENQVSQLAHKYELESNLHQALMKGDFELYFQPQFDLASKRIKSAEALIRWNNSDKGVVLPGKFMQVLEESELIIPVGKWVIQEACRAAKSWQDCGYEPIQVAVNVSALQFKNNDFVNVVEQSLHEAKLAPKYLEIEITESNLMKNPQSTIAMLKKLKALGLSISMDDFGTGYSSLNYLKQLPLDDLKIDQSFISEIPGSKDDEIIVKAIVAMSKALNLSIVAEGVESQEQLEVLKTMQCDKIQGYLISKPVPNAIFLKLLDKQNTKDITALPENFDSLEPITEWFA